jgi:hypothetical protein
MPGRAAPAAAAGFSPVEESPARVMLKVSERVALLVLSLSDYASVLLFIWRFVWGFV